MMLDHDESLEILALLSGKESAALAEKKMESQVNKGIVLLSLLQLPVLLS